MAGMAGNQIVTTIQTEVRPLAGMGITGQGVPPRATTTVIKRERFVTELMGKKMVIDVPGLGSDAVTKLNRNGITTAKQLYGYYLLYGHDNCQRMLQDAGIKTQFANTALSAISDWDIQHN